MGSRPSISTIFAEKLVLHFCFVKERQVSVNTAWFLIFRPSSSSPSFSSSSSSSSLFEQGEGRFACHRWHFYVWLSRLTIDISTPFYSVQPAMAPDVTAISASLENTTPTCKRPLPTWRAGMAHSLGTVGSSHKVCRFAEGIIYTTRTLLSLSHTHLPTPSPPPLLGYPVQKRETLVYL